MESLARITHETPEQTSLRDMLVASSQGWMKRFALIVKEVTGKDDVDAFLKGKLRCPPDVIQRMTPIVDALNVIAVMMKELASGKTAQDLQAKHGDAFRENLMYGEILAKNYAWQKEFFGHTYDMPPLPECATPERIERWKELRFELRYLPPERMSEDKNPPGWKKKPGKKYTPGPEYGVEFFDVIDQIQSLPENQSNPNLQGLTPLDLPGRWALIDTRPKPNLHFNEATGFYDQEYEDDTDIQQIINGKRNRIHPKEFSKPEFWTGIKKLLQLDDVSSATIRLPRLIEQSVLGQGSEWDGTNTREMSEEFLISGHRMVCGDSDFRGVSYVYWHVDASGRVGFRPMVVFS